ncbi:hypothetical protein G6027_03910 [Dietzia sp. SLG310A2-38A2]|uniref:hypothetical protein n=1 Tax=Dietzia sp. SLG310A2-38A2 TaxID=1630643 RepID=UPI0015F8685C|nr:hypothetical protein [Dietzia sp. SLG310A2-38A2]MBB1030048.1 hypothetical protein [Dietzia sp. SLG310A2-38A2]
MGITRVAQAAPSERPLIFVDSIATRIIGCFVVAAAGVLLLWFVVGPDEPAIAVSVCIGFIVNTGLALNWYFVGTGQPWKNLIYGTLPLLSAGLIAVVLMLFGWSSFWYGPALVILGSASVAAALVAEVRPSKSNWNTAFRVARIVGYYRTEFAIFVSQSVTAVYTAAPMALASGTMNPGDASKFASADRINSISTTGITTVGKVFQAWRSEAGGYRRAHVSTLITAALGLVGFFLITCFGGLITGVLFGALYAIDGTTAFGVGLYIFGVSLRYSAIRYYLVPSGRYNEVLAGTAISLVTLFALVVVLGLGNSPASLALSFALSEWAGVGVLFVVAIISVRRAQ